MTDDIVTRLRDHRHTLVDRCNCVRCDAAAEIERLRAAGDVLATYVRYLGPGLSDDTAALDAWKEARRG